MSGDDSRDVRRRNVLKAAAIASTGGVSAPSVAATRDDMSQEEFDEHILRARKIQSRGGPDAAVRYLEAHSIPTGYTRFISKRPDRKRTVGASTHDGTGQGDFCVEPDKCDGDIDLTLRFSYDMYNGRYYASLAMRYRYELYYDYYNYDGPMQPLDGAGIMWERDHWKLQDRDNPTSCTLGDNNVEWDNGSWNYEGVGYRVNSREIAEGSGSTGKGNYEWSDTEYAGVYLRKGSDYEDGDSIHAAYEYTWNSGELSGVSVGYPWSISVSVSSSTESEDLQTDLNGYSLLVRESDAH